MTLATAAVSTSFTSSHGSTEAQYAPQISQKLMKQILAEAGGHGWGLYFEKRFQLFLIGRQVSCKSRVV
jgi:hypothetical protein